MVIASSGVTGNDGGVALIRGDEGRLGGPIIHAYADDAQGTVTKLTADASLAVARYGWTNTVTINALGKIKLN